MDKNINYGGIIVAAGLSSRMNGFKPLLPLGGKTIIENTVDGLLRSGISDIAVVVGYRGGDIEDALLNAYGGEIKIVFNNEFESSDMMQSVKIGICAQINKDALFILPGDVPAIDVSTFIALMDAYEKNRKSNYSKVVIPTFDGRKKHPPLISSACFEFLLSYGAEGGLRAALDCFKEETALVEIKDYGCVLDADTPEQYRRLVEYVQDGYYVSYTGGN